MYQCPGVSMRDQIIEALADSPGGLTTAQIRKKLGVDDVDRALVQSIGGHIGVLNDQNVIAKIDGTWRLLRSVETQGGLF